MKNRKRDSQHERMNSMPTTINRIPGTIWTKTTGNNLPNAATAPQEYDSQLASQAKSEQTDLESIHK
tara:strand:- start:97 stop:297 length:201 start_codon:yes stop_codon:yes gene_type:complete